MGDAEEGIRVNKGEIEPRRTPGYSVRDTRGKYAIDKENGRIWFRAATSGEKADGVDILPSAWKKDIKAYMRDNPVFAERHNYEGDSIGQAVDYEIDSEGLMLQMQFAKSARAEELWQLYSNGDQRAVSVGWDTVEYKMEQRGEGEREHSVFVVTRARLLELSTCLLGLDPAAVAKYRDMSATDSRLDIAYRAAIEAEGDPGGTGPKEEPDRIAQIIERLEQLQRQIKKLHGLFPFGLRVLVEGKEVTFEGFGPDNSRKTTPLPKQPASNLSSDELATLHRLAEAASDLTREEVNRALERIRSGDT